MNTEQTAKAECTHNWQPSFEGPKYRCAHCGERGYRKPLVGIVAYASPEPSPLAGHFGTLGHARRGTRGPGGNGGRRG